MSHYAGPALLVAPDGTERPVTARLETYVDYPVELFTDNGPTIKGTTNGWRGTLERPHDGTGTQLVLAGRRTLVTVRFPEGGEATGYVVSEAASSGCLVRWDVMGPGPLATDRGLSPAPGALSPRAPRPGFG